LFGGGLGGSLVYDVVDIFNSISGLWTTAILSVARYYLAATSVSNLALFGEGYCDPTRTTPPTRSISSTAILDCGPTPPSLLLDVIWPPRPSLRLKPCPVWRRAIQPEQPLRPCRYFQCHVRIVDHCLPHCCSLVPGRHVRLKPCAVWRRAIQFRSLRPCRYFQRHVRIVDKRHPDFCST
jgi:hypothetical protein